MLKDLRTNKWAFLCLIITLAVFFLPNLIFELILSGTEVGQVTQLTFYIVAILLTIVSFLSAVLGIFLSGFKNKLLTGIFITLLGVWMGMFLPGIEAIESLELKSLDMRFNWKYNYFLDHEKYVQTGKGGTVLKDADVVVIEMSDQAVAAFNEGWPWPRYFYGHLAKNLTEAGAKVVGVDVIFDELQTMRGASDTLFAEDIAETGNVILGGKIVTTPEGQKYPVPPHSLFTDYGADWGFFSVTNDQDNSWRRYLLEQKIDLEDTVHTYPSFGLEVVKRYLFGDEEVHMEDKGGYYILGDRKIKKYDDHTILVNFYGPKKTFPYYHFDQIVDDFFFEGMKSPESERIYSWDMEPLIMIDTTYTDDGEMEVSEPDTVIPGGLLYTDVFKDKIVLVGATIEELHDDFPVPLSLVKNPEGDVFETLMPGVEIHANAIQTILDENYVTNQSDVLRIILVILVCALAFILAFRLKILTGLLSTFALVVLLMAIATYFFVSYSIHMHVVGGLLAIGFTYVGNVLFQVLSEQRDKREIKGAFGQYVPKKVVDQLVANPGLLKLGGELRHLTVMFSDVAGFTTVSEKLTPAQLVELLNEYLTAMTDIVMKYEGIVDKYEGDAIMAEFGAPIAVEDHAMRGCSCCLEQQVKLEDMREVWAKEGRPLLQARAGLNSGEVLLGNMGSSQVFDYTVMGDNVNLASRLEGGNKPYGTYIMMSEWTHELVADQIVSRELDLMIVKGKTKPVKVFEVMARKSLNPGEDERVLKYGPDITKLLEYYRKGLEAYKERRWDDGIAAFMAATEYEKYKDDQTYSTNPSKVYLQRCKDYKLNPPQADWDGVFVMTSK